MNFFLQIWKIEMPNRYVREAAIRSKAVNSLSWQGEVFWRRLLNRADDFGRFIADPELLRTEVFPRQLEKVREADISRLLAECEKAGLLYVYTVDSKSYMVMNQWERGRSKTSRYPAPPEDICTRMQTHVYTCAQMLPTPTPTQTPIPTPAPNLINRTLEVPDRGSGGKVGEPPPGRLSFAGVGRVAGEILGNDWNWFYDNCKVKLTDYTQASLMTVLKAYSGKATEKQVRESWVEAIRVAHGAAVDGLAEKPAAYAVSVFRDIMNRQLQETLPTV